MQNSVCNNDLITAAEKDAICLFVVFAPISDNISIKAFIADAFLVNFKDDDNNDGDTNVDDKNSTNNDDDDDDDGDDKDVDGKHGKDDGSIVRTGTHHIAYFLVHSLANSLYFSRSVLYILAISGTKGSSGLGSQSNEQIDNKTATNRNKINIFTNQFVISKFIITYFFL